MPHKHNGPGNPFVVLDDDGFMQLYTKEGNIVSSNEFLRVTDHMDDVSVCIGKFRCNIVANKQEMLSEIERYIKEYPGY